jgi:hypothetical protein
MCRTSSSAPHLRQVFAHRADANFEILRHAGTTRQEHPRVGAWKRARLQSPTQKHGWCARPRACGGSVPSMLAIVCRIASTTSGGARAPKESNKPGCTSATYCAVLASASGRARAPRGCQGTPQRRAPRQRLTGRRSSARVASGRCATALTGERACLLEELPAQRGELAGACSTAVGGASAQHAAASTAAARRRRAQIPRRAAWQHCRWQSAARRRCRVGRARRSCRVAARGGAASSLRARQRSAQIRRSPRAVPQRRSCRAAAFQQRCAAACAALTGVHGARRLGAGGE